MQIDSLNDRFCIFVYAGFIYEKTKCIVRLPFRMISIPLIVEAVLTNIIFSENIELFWVYIFNCFRTIYAAIVIVWVVSIYGYSSIFLKWK